MSTIFGEIFGSFKDFVAHIITFLFILLIFMVMGFPSKGLNPWM